MASKNTFRDFIHLEDLNPNVKEAVTLVELSKSRVTLDKPIPCGQTILDQSKLLTYKFHYNYIKKKYPGNQSQLCAIDTDGLIYHIKTKDFYEDIRKDINEYFDTSNFPEDHSSNLPTNVNKKVPGKMKLETVKKEVWKFAGLRSKQYAYIHEDEEEVKKNKGIKKSVVKNEIRFNDYVDTIFEGKEMQIDMRVIRSREHHLYTEQQRKKALCCKDDKRIVLEDRISTAPIGYYEK